MYTQVNITLLMIHVLIVRWQVHIGTLSYIHP